MDAKYLGKKEHKKLLTGINTALATPDSHLQKSDSQIQAQTSYPHHLNITDNKPIKKKKTSKLPHPLEHTSLQVTRVKLHHYTIISY